MSGAIKARIAGRQNAEACIAMLCDNEPPEYIQGVVTACEAFARAARTGDSGLLTMSEADAERFARERLAFGKHAGKTYGEVLEEDPEYLPWLADQALRLQSFLRASS